MNAGGRHRHSPQDSKLVAGQLPASIFWAGGVAHNCLMLAIVGRIPNAKDSIPAAGGPPRALSFWKNFEAGAPFRLLLPGWEFS